MWLPTQEEAVALYARFCIAHYGPNALKKVRVTADQLERDGDIEGKRIWSEVAREIERAPARNLPLSWSQHA